MKNFFAHPFWPFLGTAAALIVLWIEISKLKIEHPIKKSLKQLEAWGMAILSILAFIMGNIVGRSGISVVFGELNTKIVNALTVIITFFITLIFILIGSNIKKWVLK